jgi:hypothetical protein
MLQKEVQCWDEQVISEAFMPSAPKGFKSAM